MARENIEVQVVGLDQLRALNTAHTAYEKHLEKLKTLAGEAGGVTSTFTSSLNAQTAATQKNAAATKAVTDENAKLKQQLSQVRSETEKTAAGFGNLFKQAIQYRAISLVFHEVVQAISATKDAVLDFDYQLSRVRRVTEGYVPTNMVQLGMAEEMARTGRAAKDLGEAYYQLGTFIKDTDALFQAVQSTMTLVVGTEGDVRDSARANIQIFNQFGKQMDQTVSQGEQWRRINEAIAITYRNTQTEVSELIQTLKYLGPIAEAAGVPLAQVFGAVGGLEAGGIRGRMAGTSMAQLITQLMKRSIGQEGGDIKVGDYIYKNVIQRTASGGMDLIATLEGIKNKLVDLNLKGHRKEADEFIIAMGGTQNAVRAVGTLNETLERMKQTTADVAQGFKGITHVSEDLMKIMVDNLPKRMEVAWAGALAGMTTVFMEFAERINLRGLFEDWAKLGQSIATDRLTNAHEARRYSSGSADDQRGIERAALLRSLKGDTGRMSPVEQQVLRAMGVWTDAAPSSARGPRGGTDRLNIDRARQILRDMDANSAFSAAQEKVDRNFAHFGAAYGVSTDFFSDVLNPPSTTTPGKSNINKQLSPEAQEKARRKAEAAQARAEREAEKIARERERADEERASLLEKKADWFGGSQFFGPLKGMEYAKAAEKIRAKYATPVDLFGMWTGKSGPMAEWSRQQRDQSTDYSDKQNEAGRLLTENAKARREAGKALIKGWWSDPAISAYGYRMSGIQRESQVGMFGADDYSEKTRDIEKSKEALTLLITQLKQVGEDTKEWRDKLADLDADLVRLKDSKMSSDFDAVMESTGKLIELMVAPGAGKRAQDIADAKERQEEYDRLRDSVKQKAVDLGMQFYHGDIGVKGIAKGLGDMIVESHLEKMIGDFASPLVTAMTNQIASTQGLTESTDALNATMGGTVPAGHSTGSSGSSGKAMDAGMQKAMQYASAGLAGYSIFSQGQSQGITLGNAIGGAAAGASIGAGFGPGGALIGAGIGLGLDLLGGLFHKASNNPNTKQPAFYNTPSDFVYEAYRERATGKASTAFNAHQVQTNAPIVNVYIDSVKKEVRTQIEQSTSSGRIAMVNTRVDMHSII